MPRKVAKSLVRGSVALVAALLSLLLGEGLLRLLVSEEVAGRSYWGRGAFEAFEASGYRHAPGFTGRAARAGEFVNTVAIDDLGLRHGELSRAVDARRTLLVLGDSFPFGLGVREDESLPAALGRALAPSGVAVVNGGQTGYSVGQSVAFGRWLLAEVRSDAVLLTVFLANDVEGEFFADWREIDVVDGFRLPVRRWPRSGWSDWLRTQTRIGLMVQSGLQRASQRSRRRELRAAAELGREQLVDLVVAPILDFAEECRAAGLPIGVVMIPPRGRTSRDDAYFVSRLQRAGVPVLDLAERLGPEHYYARDGHWNAAGHASSAEWIEPFARELLGEPRERVQPSEAIASTAALQPMP
jgi:lysophospholipase L1-like esterase